MVSNTAEKYYRYNFKLMLILTLTMGLICVLPFAAIAAFGDLDPEIYWVFMGTAIFTALVFVAPTVYYLVQYIYYKNVLLTDVQEVVLSRTDTNNMRMIGFRVSLIEGGIEREVVTKHVFFAAKKAPVLLDDYCGRIAQVGFNAERGEYIVLVQS